MVDVSFNCSVLAVRLCSFPLPVNTSEVKLSSLFLAETRRWNILGLGSLVLHPLREHRRFVTCLPALVPLSHQPAVSHSRRDTRPLTLFHCLPSLWPSFSAILGTHCPTLPPSSVSLVSGPPPQVFAVTTVTEPCTINSRIQPFLDNFLYCVKGGTFLL